MSGTLEAFAAGFLSAQPTNQSIAMTSTRRRITVRTVSRGRRLGQIL